MTAPLPLPPSAELPADALAGRRVLITGAAAGLGAALARLAAAHGATVVLLDRNLRALEQLYDTLEAAGHPQPALYPMDLLGASPDDHAELAERLEEALGGLDALVHGAAQLGEPAPLAHYDVEHWMKTLQVNLNAPFLLTRACLPLLAGSRDARVLFISDRAGREGQAYMGAYAVAKAGLEGLMRTLAAEQPAGSPVTVASVDPGPIHTALRRSAYPGETTDDLPSADRVAEILLPLLAPATPVTPGGQYRVAPTSDGG
ncbi:SDR family NAD(P)-dependent oxidoreductase [Spiribacter halobius]|uniref:Short-chain dehydrogenase n=1 Tax=Sediminicurvatus halobius TaxID=2182432 RepID=A0A2U2N322_9GAMM|nr:SDR family NAD(P)-dependent oxidoreductase [Spiribacter halobius]PWG63483.1 short-chain dehydrogenase [Spiribacter halobius]UEX79647.1 SDR family NAD(P)-dependent oxidoreductase [Spiribacter halobius]